jgi:Ca-activated chloride channel family protein
LKQLLLVISFLGQVCLCHAQYYLRGEVRDEQNNPLPNVKIWLHSQGTNPFSSGNSGSFGIPSTLATDTITLVLEGYETCKTAVTTSKFQRFTLKMLPAKASLFKHQLLSTTKNGQDNKPVFFHNGESYNNLVENDFVEASGYPETGFALNIDRASYSNIRRFLNMGYTVPRSAVRIEEMLNYFNFGSSDSNGQQRFSCHTTLTSAPWQQQNQLLFVQLQAPAINLDQVPPSNLVFLVDASGSMDKPNRLPLLQAALHLLVKNLRAVDTVSIVTYGGNVGILLPPTSGADKKKINEAIEQPAANGLTPGEAAIKLAYQLARRSFIKDGNNRVILATDGDFNVGQSSEKELEELITQQRQSGIYLTCLGMGMGNYKDSKLEILAKRGNGNFAYLDNLKEAEKVLVTEFTKTMYAVATDAVVTIRFNPQLVKKYRLVGFDNKEDAVNDTSSEISGGEIGSAHCLVAVFEIEPNTQNNNPAGDSSVITVGKYATIRLQYRLPGQSGNQAQQFTVPFVYTPPETLDEQLKLVTAVTMFGELLKQSRFAQSYSWNEVLNQAAFCRNTADPVKQEFFQLVAKARDIYTGGTKNRKEKKNKKQVLPL